MGATRSRSPHKRGGGSCQKGTDASLNTPPSKHPGTGRGSRVGDCHPERAIARAPQRNTQPQSDVGSSSSTGGAAGTLESAGSECVGVFVLNSSGEVIATNEDTSRTAACAVPPRALRSIKEVCAATIRRFVHRNQGPAGCAWSTEFSLGELLYRCRAFPLPLPSSGPLPDHTVFLLERVPTRREALSRLSAEFRLTRRELETVDLLARGLTNKEIANTMGLSSNTVKVFLHSVMVKLGISTRAGVIGTLVTRTG